MKKNTFKNQSFSTVLFPNSQILGNSTTTTTTSISSVKTTYHILGEDVEVSSYKDSYIITNICILNVLGKPFLEELHKNGYHFPTEIEEYLDKKFKSLERDKKINDIIS